MPDVDLLGFVSLYITKSQILKIYEKTNNKAFKYFKSNLPFYEQSEICYLQVCSIMSALNMGKKKRDLVNCAQCCTAAPDTTRPCNAKLCGLSKLTVTLIIVPFRICIFVNNKLVL